MFSRAQRRVAECNDREVIPDWNARTEEKIPHRIIIPFIIIPHSLVGMLSNVLHRVSHIMHVEDLVCLFVFPMMWLVSSAETAD